MPNQQRARSGCPDLAGADRSLCTGHGTLPAEAVSAASPTPFERALETGSLLDLHGASIDTLIHQAAIEVTEKGVVDELGALRIVLTRLVTEEHDLGKLTSEVARVAAVALQAAKTQHLIKGQALAGVTDALDEILDEIRRVREREAHKP